MSILNVWYDLRICKCFYDVAHPNQKHPCISMHPWSSSRSSLESTTEYLISACLDFPPTLAQRLDGQPAPAQDTKLHLLPPKAAVANLKRFVRRHRKSEVSWGRTQQLSSCRTRFGSNLATICQCQLKDSQYAQGMHSTWMCCWVLWAAWSAGERSPITYFCSEVKKWGCSLPNQKRMKRGVAYCGIGRKMNHENG